MGEVLDDKEYFFRYRNGRMTNCVLEELEAKHGNDLLYHDDNGLGIVDDRVCLLRSFERLMPR